MSNDVQLHLKPEAVLFAVFPDPGGPSSQPLDAMMDGQVEEEVRGHPVYKQANSEVDEGMSDAYDENATRKYFEVDNDETSPDGYHADIGASKKSHDGHCQDSADLASPCPSVDNSMSSLCVTPPEEDAMMIDRGHEPNLASTEGGVFGVHEEYPNCVL